MVRDSNPILKLLSDKAIDSENNGTRVSQDFRPNDGAVEGSPNGRSRLSMLMG